MHKLLQYIGQIICFALIAIFIGYFSNRPVYHQFPEGKAQIKLAFAHGAAREIDCRRLTSKEIAKLPPNKRRPNNCSRERIPIHIQLTIDGEMIYDDLLIATGLSNDGPGRAYQKITVSAGEHIINVRLRDSKRESGFDYETTRQLTLKAHQNLAIDFKADTGGFLFR
ncbi:MAG: hypothetical protein JKX93_13625 [Rhizobiaceae bacterium]|nr:hypothetical protein [Rhizobiaceae bacterium]